ncbi:MAG TPA: SprT family zinc-dependent metalloprotease [Luteimonas sp.]|nr:SprT family zinc-dependent metalloprotease [Luteimonas sp.]
MPSMLRLLFPPRPVARPPSIRRDVVVLALDDGSTIDVLRVRDPRARRVRLSIDERGARLTLPSRASLVTGTRFLQQHRAWLVEQVRAHAANGLSALVPGVTCTLPLRDDWLALRWETGRYTCLARDGEGLLFRHTARAGHAALTRALRDFYEGEARADLGRWMPGYLPGLPRAPSRVAFKTMSSQWGSLAPDDGMVLDLALVLGRPSAFEYVLVHELCHLIRPDHSPAFWREVDARCPHWREERDYFRRDGRRLKTQLRTLLSARVA